jgi:hypothetical protein
MFREHDVVKTLVEKNGYKIGSLGVIIGIAPENKGVVLEMCDENKKLTEDWECYQLHQIKLYWSMETGKYV